MKRHLVTAAIGGGIGGLLDAIYATVLWGVILGSNPAGIWQSVAAGLLGKASFDGGNATAALGLALHFFIAFVMALVYVLASTSMGDFVLELKREKAPITVANFVSYVDKKFYDGTIFHRVIGGFMIQGGGFTENMEQKATKPPIKNEGGNGLKNDTYTLVMARTSVPDSATSQFFINVKSNDFLNRDK